MWFCLVWEHFWNFSQLFVVNEVKFSLHSVTWHRHFFQLGCKCTELMERFLDAGVISVTCYLHWRVFSAGTKHNIRKLSYKWTQTVFCCRSHWMFEVKLILVKQLDYLQFLTWSWTFNADFFICRFQILKNWPSKLEQNVWKL